MLLKLAAHISVEYLASSLHADARDLQNSTIDICRTNSVSIQAAE